MNLFGKLKFGTTLDRRVEILSAPADFSRAARREAGVLGRAWKWDARALGVPTDLPPRYVRRHFIPEQGSGADVNAARRLGEDLSFSAFTHPKTRRQRRHRARIIRAMTGRT